MSMLDEFLWPTLVTRRIIEIYFTQPSNSDYILEILNTSWPELCFVQVDDKFEAELIISFAEPDDMPKGFEHLSVYWTGNILFNSKNWNNLPPGYVYKRPNATLEAYRTHLINHEFAHHLGFGHGKCDITEQPTKKTKCPHRPPLPFDVPELE